MRGGGFAPQPEMSIAVGGYIRQKITADPYDPSIWDVDRTTCFNVHILNSKSFGSITGHALPPTPLGAEEYTKLKLPYFKDIKEPIVADIQPATAWEGMKSISQILGVNDKSVKIKVDPSGPSRAFCPYVLIKAELEALIEERERANTEAGEGERRRGIGMPVNIATRKKKKCLFM
jgi:hypothetical protein